MEAIGDRMNDNHCCNNCIYVPMCISKPSHKLITDCTFMYYRVTDHCSYYPELNSIITIYLPTLDRTLYVERNFNGLCMVNI